MFSFEGWGGEFEQREHPIPSDGHDQERHSGAQVGAGWMVIMMMMTVMTMMMMMMVMMVHLCTIAQVDGAHDHGDDDGHEDQSDVYVDDHRWL